MFKYNGNFIKNSNTAIKTFEHSEIDFLRLILLKKNFSKTVNCLFQMRLRIQLLFYENNNFEIVEEFIFNEYEVLSSSGLRELLAVEKALSSQPVYFNPCQII